MILKITIAVLLTFILLYPIDAQFGMTIFFPPTLLDTLILRQLLLESAPFLWSGLGFLTALATITKFRNWAWKFVRNRLVSRDQTTVYPDGTVFVDKKADSGRVETSL